MALRAYADAATPKPERAALRLVSIIRDQGWRSFSSRDVLRLERSGLGSKADLDPALALLEEVQIIRNLPEATNPKGGRPPRRYGVIR
jgi:hypothetical protein